MTWKVNLNKSTFAAFSVLLAGKLVKRNIVMQGMSVLEMRAEVTSWELVEQELCSP